MARMDKWKSYLNTNEDIPNGMGIVHWGYDVNLLILFWVYPCALLILVGMNGTRYPTWHSIACDYLAVMASSVSSERAFSAAGITISKRRNRLNGDIAEAVQCLKSPPSRYLVKGLSERGRR